MERRFGKNLDSLGQVFGFLEQFTSGEEITEEDSFAINLVVEELFTNMVKYSGGEDRGVAISIGREDRWVTLRLTDFDSDPFDPASLGAVDVGAPVAERQPGGLGIHIVKTLVEDLSYDFEERKLTVTATRSLKD